ncbi:DUF763 domain-containing protein [Sphingobacterium spiritivorum]|uniref:DUF763 domain-containing protein n=1 Tax=Sphingobacterium spiritivorum ATCC 33861 TaxID=525373 RepID=D7VRY9_SPHSI|nr:DUF763 domain-containing protein [Sphingobacterium spiritivorum]EFK56540.1 hypothetical protein HMPREF0766_13743 [Sphingobacterium spiritivorum ATCC 33861]QQT35396.1 DUF763 domain-containing protein [Sphingobacterium spiritivorum]WQD32082.1 DUF763 domain-containing protein [Sphingobacterium spiritivorum]SUJ05617.1 Protein of uncharacterised function (DUF763) [Sphingobacterium spiritivorum]
MKRSGTADLPLHYGHVPLWLAERMGKLGLAIVEEIISHKGKNELLSRLSNPFWFQSLGAVMGMDWHSSGITTSVMGALKRSINPHAKEFGIYVCGGKGKLSRQTPLELARFAEYNGLDAADMVRCSKLAAKVDNTAVQDGFQLYQHNFVVSNEGQWTVIQQGMSDASSTARRYHWHSSAVQSFTEEPHTFIYGQNCGEILNLTDKAARPIKEAMLSVVAEDPRLILKELTHLVMPVHHDVRSENVDLKRLGSVLWLAQDNNIQHFEELLLLKGMGPRTLQSLALVSEVIHGSPARFRDPARFSFAHGGKDGHPFPVPVTVYDDTIQTLQNAIQRSRLGNSDKTQAIKSLSQVASRMEEGFTPNDNFDKVIEKERADSWKYGGRTVFGKAKPPLSAQLNLFD